MKLKSSIAGCHLDVIVSLQNLTPCHVVLSTFKASKGGGQVPVCGRAVVAKLQQLLDAAGRQDLQPAGDQGAAAR